VDDRRLEGTAAHKGTETNSDAHVNARCTKCIFSFTVQWKATEEV